MSALIRRVIGVAAAAGSAAALAVSLATPADAATSQHWGREYFLITIADSHETVVAHGAFAGAGVDEDQDQSDVENLGGGSVTIYHPDSKAKYSFKLNPKTCFSTITGTGRYTLGAGTGRFTGVTGHGTYVLNEQAVVPRKKDGTCNASADPKHFAGYVKASGPVYRG